MDEIIFTCKLDGDALVGNDACKLKWLPKVSENEKL